MAEATRKTPNPNGDYRDWNPDVLEFWSLMATVAERRLAKERAGKDHRGDLVSD